MESESKIEISNRNRKSKSTVGNRQSTIGIENRNQQIGNQKSTIGNWQSGSKTIEGPIERVLASPVKGGGEERRKKPKQHEKSRCFFSVDVRAGLFLARCACHAQDRFHETGAPCNDRRAIAVCCRKKNQSVGHESERETARLLGERKAAARAPPLNVANDDNDLAEDGMYNGE